MKWLHKINYFWRFSTKFCKKYFLSFVESTKMHFLWVKMDHRYGSSTSQHMARSAEGKFFRLFAIKPPPPNIKPPLGVLKWWPNIKPPGLYIWGGGVYTTLLKKCDPGRFDQIVTCTTLCMMYKQLFLLVCEIAAWIFLGLTSPWQTNLQWYQ